MQAKDVRELTEQELEVKERDLKEAIFRFRLRRGTNQLDNPAAFRNARRDLARVHTIRNQRRRASQKSE